MVITKDKKANKKKDFFILLGLFSYQK